MKSGKSLLLLVSCVTIINKITSAFLYKLSKKMGNKASSERSPSPVDENKPSTLQEKTRAIQQSIEEKTKAVQVSFDNNTKAMQNMLGLNKAVSIKVEPAVEDFCEELAQTISTVGTNTEYGMNQVGLRLLPNGSAFYTSSGSLSSRGIKAIIHAASGSSSRDGRGLTPTLHSVANCVRNALILAKRRNHTKIAIPFIGGALFLTRIGTTLDLLANAIIRAVLDNRGSMQVALVPFGPQDTWLFQQVLENLLKEPQYASTRNDGSVEVTPGDITRYDVHGADVIVNAANTEGKFGGGVSGAIGQATGNKTQIDHEASKIIAAFISKYINHHK